MKELKRFIRFNYRLYKGNPYSVPDLYDDMLNTFNKKKNAAFEFCEAEYFLKGVIRTVFLFFFNLFFLFYVFFRQQVAFQVVWHGDADLIS